MLANAKVQLIVVKVQLILMDKKFKWIKVACLVDKKSYQIDNDKILDRESSSRLVMIGHLIKETLVDR